MNQPWPPVALMAKTDRACLSARTLLDAGDVDGACNRAYYAIFDAARAALLACDAPLTAPIGKTHRGLINLFSERLVKSGTVSIEMGRLLKRAEEVRLIADYRGDSVELTDARATVEQAEIFVSAVHAPLPPEDGNDDRRKTP